MTKVIFVRHGEAEGNIERNFHGHYNSNLTENGRAQIKLTAKRLKDEKIDVIYSSDLNRTYETALAIAEGRNLSIVKNEKLREINGGKWEDVPWDELPSLFPESYDYWLRDPQKLVMPSGESMVDFQNRVLSAVLDIVKLHKNSNILIVTHGTVIKVLLCKYKNKTLSDLPNLAWHDNASITIVEFDDDFNPNVVLEGDNEHLGDLSTIAKQSWWRKELVEGKR